MGKNGGKRPGAGRKVGSKNRATLERQVILAAFNQRVMQQADALFNAQLVLAVGSVKVFRVDEEEGENGKTKRVHTLVTDAEEIKSVLDEHEGDAGVVGESYYFVSDVLPDNRAIEGMMNRAFGKPKETVEHQNPAGNSLLRQIAATHLQKLREEFKPQLESNVISDDFLVNLTCQDTGASKEELVM